MANSTKCLTNGAVFHTSINEDSISAKVSLPFDLNIKKEEAEILETLIHNSLEIVLRPYFFDKSDKSMTMEDNFRSKIKDALDNNEALCMDNAEEREKLFEEIVSGLSKTEWWE
jgi:DNA-binding response OmpR family regulator